MLLCVALLIFAINISKTLCHSATLYLEETRLAPSSAVDKVTANGLAGRHAGNSRKWQKVLCGVKKNCQSHKLIFTQNNFLDFKILAA